MERCLSSPRLRNMRTTSRPKESGKKADETNWTAVFFRLTSVPRTEKEIRRRIAEQGCPPQTSEQLIAQGQACGLIDDDFYARAFVQAKQDWGRRRLFDELASRGVRRETVANAMEQEGVDDRARACALAVNWLGRNLSPEKVFGRLIRRGFSGTDAKGAICAALREKNEEE